MISLNNRKKINKSKIRLVEVLAQEKEKHQVEVLKVKNLDQE